LISSKTSYCHILLDFSSFRLSCFTVFPLQMASSSRTIAIAAIAASFAAILAVAFVGYPSLNQNALAQSDSGETNQVRRSLTYFVTDTVHVPVNENASAQAFCQDRDVLLTGGYAIGGFDSPDKVFNTVLYSNTAFHTQNSTSTHEGWQAGLANMGTAQLMITANAVCLDVTPEAE
jgi:hypothetical protein